MYANLFLSLAAIVVVAGVSFSDSLVGNGVSSLYDNLTVQAGFSR